jgi:hypothetical protein
MSARIFGGPPAVLTSFYVKKSFFHTTAYFGNSAAGFGNSERTTILGRLCGVNGGWRIALNFCFFLFKQKENKKIKKHFQ